MNLSRDHASARRPLWRLFLATCTALVAAGLSLASSSDASGTTRPSVIDCTHHHGIKPTSIILTCADAGRYVDHLRYTEWSAHAATGTGVVVINPCQPTCVASRPRSYAMTFAIYRPVSRTAGPVFSRLAITLAKPHRGVPRNWVETLVTR